MLRSVFSRRQSASPVRAALHRRKARLNSIERLEPRAMLATIAFNLFSDRSDYNESVSGAVIRTEDWGGGNTVKYWTQQYSYSSASITYTFSFQAPVVSASLVAPVDTPFPGSTGNGYLDVSTGGKWTTVDSCLSQYNGKTNAGYEPIDISPYVNGSTSISVRARLANSGPVGGQFLRSASWDTTPVLRLTVIEQNVTPTDVILSGDNIAENSDIDAFVGHLSTTDLNTGDSFTYTLVSGTGSTDNSIFNISGNELRANVSFDFETKDSYSVRVRSTDQGGLSTEKTFTISVANVNETPTNLALSATSIAESGGVNAVVGTLSTTDPDAGNAFNYALVSGTGDTDNAAFNISGNQLWANASLDFETKSSYSIRVRSADQGGLYTEKAFTITVTNVNEIPSDIAISAATIAENAGANAVVGTLSTTDPDASNTFTYSLVAGAGGTDNAAFNISGNQLRASSNINFGARNSYSVRVRSTDQGGLFTEKAFTITVTPTNVAPTGIDLGNTEWLLWNAGGQIWRSKPNGTDKAVVVTPTTGASITCFDIDEANGRIYFSEEVLNAASNSKIFSTALDGSDRKIVYNGTGLGHVSYSMTVDAAAGYVFLHSHDPAPVAAVGPFFDGKIQRLTIATGTVSILPTTFWYVHDLEVSTTSKLFLTGLNVNDENFARLYNQRLDGTGNQEVHATGLAALNFALAERTNSIYVSTGSQSATTGDVYRIPLEGGNPVLVFDGTQAIHDVEWEEPTGILYWITDTSIYRSSIQGTNAEAVVTGLTGTENKHLSVVTSTTRTVPENAPTGTVVGLLSASDANPGNSFTYSLATGIGSDDNAGFQIINGQLATNAVFDFEAKSSYSVRIRATDQGGLFTEKTFTITVTNVNETPTDIALSASSIAENASVNAVVGTLSTTDPDASNTFTYSLVSGTGSTDNAAFTISGNQLKANASFDFETKKAYSVRVRSTDQGGLFTEKAFAVDVTDLNEAVSFSFGFKHVNQTGADSYLVDSTGMRKYSEWQNPQITYWGPSANNTEGRLVYKFPFSTPTTSMRLFAHSPSWDFFNEPGGNGRGASAIEVSKDGLLWISLRNSLEPRQWGVDWTYNDTLPSTVLGGNELWVRMRFYVESAPNSSYTVAQFGRSTSAATEDVFAVQATFANNRAPVDVSLSSASVAENAGANALVGNLSTTDPDAGNTFTYTLVTGTGDTDNAAFNISGNQLRATASLNFETKNSYTVRIRATDQGGLFTEKAFTITVTNVNEAPTTIFLSKLAVPENAPIGITASNFSTTDPDVGDTFTYTLVSGTGDHDNSSFTIAGNALRTAANFDYETKSNYSIRVRSTDTEGNSIESSFAITVIDVVEDWSVVTPDGTESVDGSVRSGSSRLVKSGLGTLVLDRANSHTGGVVVNAGRVVVRNPQALGAGTLWVKSGASVVLDVGYGIVPTSVLILEAGGSIDFGHSLMSINQLGYVLADVQAWFRAGRRTGFNTATAGMQSRFVSDLRTIGYNVNWDGSLMMGYAAMGDTDLSGEVDIIDITNIVGGGMFDSSESASWSNGDFNHDGLVDVLDMVTLVSSGLFNNGSYKTARSNATASSATPTTETSSMSLSVNEIAFISFGVESAMDSARVKKSRMVSG